MKKKGLIIATVVMVLVLAVSLTTATYAWFSNEGTASITPISFAVGSSADIVIGVEKDNEYKSSSVSQSDFWSGATVYDKVGGTWTGDDNALGLAVNTGLDLSALDGAVYTFTSLTGTSGSYTAGTMDTYTNSASSVAANTSHAYQVSAGINLEHTALIGTGTGAGTNYTIGSFEDAVNTDDYLNIALGSAPAKTSVLAYGCLVYIKPTATTKTTLGLNAAIHVAYSLNGAATVEYDVYGANSYGTTRESMTAPTLPSATISGETVRFTSANISTAPGDAYIWIPLYTAASYTNSTTYATADTSVIDQIQLVIYLCGPDGDCITDGTGVGSTITIEYLSLNASQWATAIAG